MLASSLPTDIGRLTSLETIDMNGSDLYGDLPSEIGMLTQLRELDLSSNLLSNIPSEIGSLTLLGMFHLCVYVLVDTVALSIVLITSLIA